MTLPAHYVPTSLRMAGSPIAHLDIETATDGRVSCSDLRPDIWPPEPPIVAAVAEERGAA